jgi:hypothetical protein
VVRVGQLVPHPETGRRLQLVLSRGPRITGTTDYPSNFALKVNGTGLLEYPPADTEWHRVDAGAVTWENFLDALAVPPREVWRGRRTGTSELYPTERGSFDNGASNPPDKAWPMLPPLTFAASTVAAGAMHEHDLTGVDGYCVNYTAVWKLLQDAVGVDATTNQPRTDLRLQDFREWVFESKAVYNSDDDNVAAGRRLLSATTRHVLGLSGGSAGAGAGTGTGAGALTNDAGSADVFESLSAESTAVALSSTSTLAGSVRSLLQYQPPSTDTCAQCASAQCSLLVPLDLLLGDDDDHGCQTPGRGCYQTRHRGHHHKNDDDDTNASEMAAIALGMLFLVLLALFAYSSCGAHRATTVYVPLHTTKPPLVAHNDDGTAYVFNH